MARQVVICIVVILAGLLPVIFRSRYWLRLICVAILVFQAFLHLFFLDAETRFVSGSAAAKNGGRRPLDFESARAAVREVSHSELPLTASLFTALVLLALTPYRRADKHET